MKLPILIRDIARRTFGRPDVLTDYAYSLAWLAINAGMPIAWTTPEKRVDVAALGDEQKVHVVFDRPARRITVWENGGPVQPWHGVPDFWLLQEFLAGLLGLGKYATATTLT